MQDAVLSLFDPRTFFHAFYDMSLDTLVHSSVVLSLFFFFFNIRINQRRYSLYSILNQNNVINCLSLPLHPEYAVLP